MSKRSIVFIFFILVFSYGKAQEILPKSYIQSDTSRVKIVFAGDMMGHMPLISSTYDDSTKSYNYNSIFEYIKAYVSSADLAIVNLEVTLAGPPFSGYPQFSSPDSLASGLKNAGFSMFITANNHSLDRGGQGLERTIRVLDSLNIIHTGTFKDSSDKSQRHPLFLIKNHIILAFLNYTYGTNGLNVQAPNIVNYIDTSQIRKDIEVCKGKADFIIVTVHWGIEYQRIPNKEQYAIAEFVKKCGANVLIGSHPHVIQPFVKFYNASDSSGYFPVIFSLGNFVSNQRDRYRDGGIIFELTLEKTISTKVKSCAYLPVWVYRGPYKGKVVYKLIPPPHFDETVSVFPLGGLDKQKCLEFFDDTRQHLNNLQEVNNGR